MATIIKSDTMLAEVWPNGLGLNFSDGASFFDVMADYDLKHIHACRSVGSFDYQATHSLSLRGVSFQPTASSVMEVVRTYWRRHRIQWDETSD